MAAGAHSRVMLRAQRHEPRILEIRHGHVGRPRLDGSFAHELERIGRDPPVWLIGTDVVTTGIGPPVQAGADGQHHDRQIADSLHDGLGPPVT